MRSVKVRTYRTCPDCGRLTTWHCVIAESDDPYGFRSTPVRTTTCALQRDESACQCAWTKNEETWEGERVADELLVEAR